MTGVDIYVKEEKEDYESSPEKNNNETCHPYSTFCSKITIKNELDIENASLDVKPVKCEEHCKNEETEELSQESPGRSSTSSEGREYCCFDCGFSTTKRSKMKKHIRNEQIKKHHQATLKWGLEMIKDKIKGKGLIGDYACKLCLFRSKYECSLKRHVQLKHLNIRRISCPYCEFKTNSNQNLNFHIAGKHERARHLACPDCDYKAGMKHHLERHIILNHSGASDKLHSCPLCSYSSLQIHHLKRHLITVHTDDKPFPCHLCSYRANRKHVLQRHLECKHSQGRDISCPFQWCPFKTKRNDYMKKHIDAKHSKEKHLNCPYCSYKASFQQCLKAHVAKQHTSVNDLPSQPN